MWGSNPPGSTTKNFTMRITMHVENVHYDEQLKEVQGGNGEGLKPWRVRTKVIETGLMDENTVNAPVGEKINYIDLTEVRLKSKKEVEDLILFLQNTKLGIEKGPMKFDRVKSMGEGLEESIPESISSDISHQRLAKEWVGSEVRSTNDV